MDRVLLQVKRKKERRHLEDWLAKSHHLILPDPEQPLEEVFDLAIIDGASLKQLRSLVRYGGDEFIVILPRQSKDEARLKVARMRQAITATPFLQKEGIDAHLTASFGLAAFPEDAADKHELLAEADRCLFQSKTEGKDRITLAQLERAA
jgi:predicted signal transduction protein with EAL and GGDEF domain